MKQGSGKTIMDTKTEPTSKAASESYSTQLGASTHYKKHSMYEGRGYNPPKPKAVTSHRSGSQGKH